MKKAKVFFKVLEVVSVVIGLGSLIIENKKLKKESEMKCEIDKLNAKADIILEKLEV